MEGRRHLTECGCAAGENDDDAFEDNDCADRKRCTHVWWVEYF